MNLPPARAPTSTARLAVEVDSCTLADIYEWPRLVGVACVLPLGSPVPLPSTLVVDDDATVANALRAALGDHPVSVTIAPDAETAKQLLGSEQFCGIVLDLMLDGSNGREVLDYLAAQQMHIPTVVVSQRLPPEVRESLDEEQVKLCFAKPIEPRLLATIVLSLCGISV